MPQDQKAEFQAKVHNFPDVANKTSASRFYKSKGFEPQHSSPGKERIHELSKNLSPFKPAGMLANPRDTQNLKMI